jgi:hypothetical protein
VPAPHSTLPPGYTVVYPNREKASSQTAKLIVILLLAASVVLMLAVTIGGWSKLQGLKPINFAWCAVYVIIAVFVARWSRGLLPIAAAMAVLLLILGVIAATGYAGTSWFDRNHAGFAHANSLFGGTGLGPDTLGLLTWLIVPVQGLLIFFSMTAFGQGWNVEQEVPIEEARRRGSYTTPSPPAAPAAA